MSNCDNIAFYNPWDAGCWDLGTTQVDKALVFAWDTVCIPESTVSILRNGTVIESYTIGNGLTLSNGDLTITLVLQGADFDQYAGETLKAECNFFVDGDVEVIFDLQIIKTNV